MKTGKRVFVYSIVVALLCVVLCFAPFIAVNAEPVVSYEEDINGDALLNAEDLAKLKNAVFNENGDTTTDLNGDGFTNILDLVLLKKAVLSYIDADKFDCLVNDNYTIVNLDKVTLGELFTVGEGLSVKSEKVRVVVQPSDNVTYTYTANENDWALGELAFTGVGTVKVYIHEYSLATELVLNIVNADKFISNGEKQIYVDESLTLGELFSAADREIDSSNVAIKVNGEEITLSNTTDWAQNSITFSEEGTFTVAISENSNEAEATVTVVPLPYKFEVKLEGNTLNNVDTYTLGDLFALKSGFDVVDSNVEVKVECDSTVEYTIATAENWEDTTIAFDGIGKATIIISEYSQPTELVVDIVNVDKFVSNGNKEIYVDESLTLGDLFSVADREIDSSKVSIKVNGEAITLSNTTDWTQNSITFSEEGTFTVAISENSNEAEATVIVVPRPIIDKFSLKFPNTEDYLYRVGNLNTVSLGSLFGTLDGVKINSANVTVETVAQKGDVTATYTANNTDWTKGTLKFAGTGIVDITIEETNGSHPLSLTVEVINATNATSAASAKTTDVVLLNDVGLHTIEVTNGYTLYGNGFKMTAANDVMYDAMNAGFVVLKNGTLDNVQIVCPNFSYSILYSNQIKNAANTAVPSDSSTNDARGNVRSAVMVDGNSSITNSYIHGGRAALFLRSGNLVVDNSTISGGAAANIHTVSAQSLTLRNATLIQKPFVANVNDTSKTIMGFSGLFECDESGNSTPLILEGKLIQEAWINEEYKVYAPSEASSIITTALSKTDYLHDLDGDGTKESLNLGFTYIPQNTGGSTNANVTDNRTDKNTVPYSAVDVGNVLASAKVYSYANSKGTSAEFQNVSFAPTTQAVSKPTVNFADTNADRVFKTVFDTSDNRWESTLEVNLDNGDYTFDFSKLLVQKYGENLSYTVKKADGTAIDTSKTIALATSGVTDYVLTVTDGNATHTVYFVLIATKSSIPEPEVADTTGGTPLLVVKSKDSDWSCAIPALEGIKIKYWTSASSSTVLDLATLTPTSTGKQNGTNNFWETTKDGYKLKVSCGYIHDTKQIYGMPVVVNNGGNKMYFTISSTNGYVSTSTSGRTVTLTYEFTDPNGSTLKFSKTWQFNYADYKSGKQYSYSDFVNGTLKEATSGGGCVTPDTLVTLADGSKKEIQYVTNEDMLLVWDFYNGEYAVVPAAIVFNMGTKDYNILKLEFADGTTVKTINGHRFFNKTLNEFVLINEDTVDLYVGHQFVKAEGEGYTTVELLGYDTYSEYTTSYSIMSALHYNFIVEGMLSDTFHKEDSPLFDYFNVGEDMKYDVQQMQADIEKYGLYTYEDFADYLTYEQFLGFNVQYFKISVDKGLFTYEQIIDLINTYLG